MLVAGVPLLVLFVALLGEDGAADDEPRLLLPPWLLPMIVVDLPRNLTASILAAVVAP